MPLFLDQLKTGVSEVTQHPHFSTTTTLFLIVIHFFFGSRFNQAPEPKR